MTPADQQQKQSDRVAFDGGCWVKPRFKRLVVVLIDALRDDFARFDKLFKTRFRRRKCWSPVEGKRENVKRNRQTKVLANIACYAKYNDKET